MSAAPLPNVLCDWLQSRGVISAEQAELVCGWMASRHIDEESAMQECGVLNEDDLVSIYGEIQKVRPIKLEDLDIDGEATRHVPARLARAHLLIPIRRSANTLAVVMSDPLSSEAHAALKAVTDFEIIPFAGRVDAIEHAIFLHYGPENAEAKPGLAVGAVSPAIRARLLSNDDRVSHISKSLPLQRDWTFATYWKATENQYALTVLQQLSDSSSDDSRSCISLWGPAGCGKSHLIHAAANELSGRQPMSRAMLTTGARFADFLFESVRDHKLNLFRYLYRELDLLLIDRADDLLLQDWAQQELAETLAALVQKKKRAVLASSVNLTTSPRLLPELRKLLEAGTIAEIKAYGQLGKLEILRRKAAGAGLPNEVLAYLARQGGDDLSQLLEMTKALVVMAARGADSLSEETVAGLLHQPFTHATSDVIPLAADGIAILPD